MPHYVVSYDLLGDTSLARYTGISTAFEAAGGTRILLSQWFMFGTDPQALYAMVGPVIGANARILITPWVGGIHYNLLAEVP